MEYVSLDLEIKNLADQYVSYFKQKDLNPFTADDQVPRHVIVEDEEPYVWEGSSEALPSHAFDEFTQKYFPKE